MNLGTLYHTAAIKTENVQEKQHYFDLAEGMLQKAKQCDLGYGKVRLAHVYYSRGKYDQAIQELQGVMDVLEGEHSGLLVQGQYCIYFMYWVPGLGRGGALLL